MSDETKSVSDGNQGEGSQSDKEQFVSRKAYEEVTRDMHKFKKEREELKAGFNELQAQLKAQEEAKMQENEQWKQLYEKRESELEEERNKAKESNIRFTNAVKRSALKQELGGKVKDEYLSFADLSSISMSEDGMVDSETLRNVANDFRKQHGQLIPKEEGGEITGHGSTVDNVQQKFNPVGKSAKELVAHYASLKQNN